MKKALFVFSLFLILIPYQQIQAQKSILFRFLRNLSPFVEIQTSNKVVLSNKNEQEIFHSFSSIAYGFEIPVNIERTNQVFGPGIEFQKSEVIDSALSFKNMPVYWFFKQRITKDSSFYIPDIIVKIGYNFLTVSEAPASRDYAESDGLFYALGLSFKIDKHVDLRITYKSSQGKLIYSERAPNEIGGYDIVEHSVGVDNQKITIGFNIIL